MNGYLCSSRAEQSRSKTTMAMTQSLIGYPPSSSSSSSSKFHVFCCQPKTSPSSLPRRTDGGISAVSKSRRKENEALTKKQPSISEIERAIGAGIFPDSDRDSENGNSLLESIASASIGESEGFAERKLRETGEWLVLQSEKRSNSAGKNILKVLFLWALPIWAVSFLVASGLVKLPFGSTYLDDLMM